MSENAWVTLATNDSYSLGALVLAHSLRQVGTSHQLVCIITPGISDPMREKLSSVFDIIFEVNLLDSKDEANLLLMQRPELGVTFTKLHCWRLTQFKKCVFLDADTLVLQNCDELFERDEFSAAPDVGWPDCFNSGVFVYQPSQATYESLIKFALENRSFDGGDQGLLNLYFSDWAHKDISKHLPFLYNMCSTACYSYLPAFKQFGEGMKIIHFIGATKPWLQYFNSETLKVNVGAGMEHLQNIVQLWWDIFCTHVHKTLSTHMDDCEEAPLCGVASYNPIPNPSKYLNDESMLDESLITYDDNITHPPFIDPWETYKNSAQDTSDEREDLVDRREDHTNNNYSVQNNVTDNEIRTNCNTDCRANHENVNNNFTDSTVCVTVDTNVNSNETNECASEHNQTKPNKVFDKNDSNSSTLQEQSSTNPSSPSYNAMYSNSNCNYLNGNNLHQENANTALPDESRPGDDTRQENGGLAGALAQMSLGQPRTDSQSAFEDHMRKQSWEVGNIDYMGRDRFDNIWSKISETLAIVPAQTKPEPVQTRKKSPSPKPKQTPIKEPPKQEQKQPAPEPVQEKKPSPQQEKPVAVVEKKPVAQEQKPAAKSTPEPTKPSSDVEVKKAAAQTKKQVESPKSPEPPKTTKLVSAKVPSVESPTSATGASSAGASSAGAGAAATSPTSPTPPPRKTTQTQKKQPKKK